MTSVVVRFRHLFLSFPPLTSSIPHTDLSEPNASTAITTQPHDQRQHNGGEQRWRQAPPTTMTMIDNEVDERRGRQSAKGMKIENRQRQ